MDLHNRRNVLSMVRFVGQEPILSNAEPRRFRCSQRPRLVLVEYADSEEGLEVTTVGGYDDPLTAEELNTIGFMRDDRCEDVTWGNYVYLKDGTFFLTHSTISHVLLPTLIGMGNKSVVGAGQYYIRPSGLSTFGQAMSLGENNRFMYTCIDFADYNAIAAHLRLRVPIQEASA